MMIEFSESLAREVGVREAIIAQYLWETLLKSIEEGTETEREHKLWVKASGRDLTAAFPFFSKDGCLDALRNLRDAHILVKGSFNDSRFDHTYWHAFTGYGMKMILKETEVAENDRTGEENEEYHEGPFAPVFSRSGYGEETERFPDRNPAWRTWYYHPGTLRDQ